MAQVTSDLPSKDSRRPSHMPTSSTMKLPQMLRRSSTIDASDKSREKEPRRISVQESDRRPSLLRLRRRKTLPTTELSEDDAEAASRLARLFFSLPSEILSRIIRHFEIADIFHLRLTNRTFSTILSYNASAITRPLLESTLSSCTAHHIQKNLYPLPPRCRTFNHLLRTLRRHTLITSHINNLLKFVQMKIYMTGTTTRIFSAAQNRAYLSHVFHRPAWFTMHFLEAYRSILVYWHGTHASATSTTDTCAQCRAAAKEVVAGYPAEEVVGTWHFYQLTLEHLQLATREPVSAGSLERRLRGWKKAATTGQSLAIFVILGGVPQLRKVALMEGSFNSRSGFVREFVERVREAVVANSVVGMSSGVAEERDELMDSLSPPFHVLAQEHIASLPDVTTFFYDVWKDRLQECAEEGENVLEPYAWLQKIMEGTGLDFGNSRALEPPLALGASAV